MAERGRADLLKGTSVEREARFLVRDEPTRRALIRLRTLGRLRCIRVRQERQRNVYLDTPDLRLRRARSVLKLRQVGSKWDLTYKRSQGVHRGIAQRLEVTAPIHSSQLARLSAGGLMLAPLRRVRRIIGDRPLTRLFTLFTHRYCLIFSDGRFRVEVDVDRVALQQGRRVRARRLEVEVENLSATPAVFRRAVAALRRQFGEGLEPTAMSKFEYGLRASTRRSHSAVTYA